MDALPDTVGIAAEIIVQRGHRNAYDRAFRTAGARIVEVGYPWIEGVGLTYEWQLEAAFSERTVAVGHLALADADGVPLRRVCELAAAHGVPVIVDAAAELPPSSNLRRFVDEGAALVAFSGGKAIRGPQGSGVLAGRRELIESVRLQTLDMDVDVESWIEREATEPPHHGLGRSMKVGKEQIAGLVVALREFAGRDHEAEAAEHARLARDPAGSLAGRPSAVRADLHFYPRLVDRGRGRTRASRGAARRRRARDRRAARAARARRARHLSRGDHGAGPAARRARARRPRLMGSWTLAGATVVDGTGAAGRTADVVIEDDRIAAIGSGERRGTVIDADGAGRRPGLRRHPLPRRLDRAARGRPRAARRPTCARASRRRWEATAASRPPRSASSFNRGAIEQMLLVGSVTADLGWSWSSVREYLDEIERRGLPFNVASTSATARSARPSSASIGARRLPPSWRRWKRCSSRASTTAPSGSPSASSTSPAATPARRRSKGSPGSRPRRDALVAVHTRGISELFDPAMDEAIGFAQGERLPAPARAREPDGTRELGRDRPALRRASTPRARPGSTSRSTSSATPRGR